LQAQLKQIGLTVTSGYSFYPDNQHKDFDVTQQKGPVPPHASINPPWSNDILKKHISFWVKMSEKQFCTNFLILPARVQEDWFKFFWHSFDHPVWIFNNTVWFKRLDLNGFIGPYKKKVCIIALNVAGGNAYLENDF